METAQATEETKSLPFRMMVVLSPDMLADAITKAHGVKMKPDDFAGKSARLILASLPPLYYEPRNEK